MKSEFTLQAKTVEEAYAKANDIYSSLGDISIEVVNPGKKGILGFGRVLAEIKVIVDEGQRFGALDEADFHALDGVDADYLLQKQQHQQYNYTAEDT